MKKIAIFTGAGISKESGVPTFRYSKDALWDNTPVDEVATPQGWKKDRQKVLDFYNARRQQLKTIEPNLAHKELVKLEENYDVTIITQNVDDLHERGGSKNVVHLHGSLTKAQSSYDPSVIVDIGYNDINIGDKCEHGSQLRPNVVWFGEAPNMHDVIKTYDAIENCDILIIIGTSLQIGYTTPMLASVKEGAEVFYIDPEPSKYLDAYEVPVIYIDKPATEGVSELVKVLMNR